MIGASGIDRIEAAAKAISCKHHLDLTSIIVEKSFKLLAPYLKQGDKKKQFHQIQINRCLEHNYGLFCCLHEMNFSIFNHTVVL